MITKKLHNLYDEQEEPVRFLIYIAIFFLLITIPMILFNGVYSFIPISVLMIDRFLYLKGYYGK